MTIAICSSCKIEKPIGDFGARPERPSGRRSRCRECERASVDKWRAANPEKVEAARKAVDPERRRRAVAAHRDRNREAIRRREKDFRDANREQLRERERQRYAERRDAIAERKRLWREKNGDRLREQEKQRRATNPEWARKKDRRSTQVKLSSVKGRLENTIRTRMVRVIGAPAKGGRRTFDLLGYTGAQLREHLEAKFQPGMSWDNYGFNGWHVDHVLPLASFAYATPDDPEFRVAWSLNNLQPLWADENRRKGAKMPAESAL